MVKELRDRTGAGMMECKKSLLEANGDMDRAIELLRTSGQAKAEKKASRIAAEGRIVIANNSFDAVLVEVNSETDFVAKDKNFVDFTNSIAESLLSTDLTELDKFNNYELSNGRTIENIRTDLIAKVGENISIRRFSKIRSI